MARKPTAAKAAPAEDTKSSGRNQNPETAQRLEHILTRAKEEPGVTSPTLARELDITTLQCSQLGDRLVKRGELAVFKLANGVRALYLPKVLEKQLPKLEKQRDADLADRDETRKAKAREALAELKTKKAAKDAAEKADGAKPARKRAPKAAAAPTEPKPSRKRTKASA